MDTVRTTRCIICGGNPDMHEDVELKVLERIEPKVGIIMRHDLPPKLLVEGRICQTCYDNLRRLPRT